MKKAFFWLSRFGFVLLFAMVIGFTMVGCDDGNTDGSGEGLLYSVVFNVNGGEGAYEDQSVERGSTIKNVTEPIKNGYKFLGWFYGNSKWDFTNNAVTDNIELVAEWEKDESCWGGTVGFTYMKLTGNKVAITEYAGVDTLVTVPMMVDIDGEEYTVSVLGDGVFKDFYAVRQVTLPSTITSLGDECFMNCGVRELTLPSGVTNIGNSCFYGAKRLKKVVFGDNPSVKIIGDDAFRGTIVGNFIVPDSVEEIGDRAFMGLGFTSVLFGNESRLLTIGERAFYDNNLTIIDLPNGVSSVGERAFGDNENLEKVVIPSSLIYAGNDIFEGDALLDCVFVCGIDLDTSLFSGSWNRIGYNTLGLRWFSAKANYVGGSWRYVNNVPTVWSEQVEFNVDLTMYDGLADYSVTLFCYTYDGKYEHAYVMSEDDGVFSYTLDVYPYAGFRVAIFELNANYGEILDATIYSNFLTTGQFDVRYEKVEGDNIILVER